MRPLTPRQFHILCIVRDGERDPLTTNQLSQRRGESQVVIARTLASLRERALVLQDPRDQTWRLTRHGLKELRHEQTKEAGPAPRQADAEDGRAPEAEEC